MHLRLVLGCVALLSEVMTEVMTGCMTSHDAS